MAGNKYLSLISGRIKEVIATVTSTGAPDADKVVALDGTGRLDSSLMPVGFGADTKSIIASETLSAGNLVNVWNSSGTPKVRKADATTSGKEANGFVLSAVSSSASATVYFEGTITGLGGMTPGTRMYLSAVSPGELVDTPPSTPGNVVQYIGTATSTTELCYEATDGVILA